MNVSVQRAAKLPAAVPASEFHKRLDELLPMIEAQANEAETLGYLTDDVVAAMRKAGIYTMLFPKAVGGAELSPLRRHDRDRTPVLRPCVGRLVRHRQQHGRHHPGHLHRGRRHQEGLRRRSGHHHRRQRRAARLRPPGRGRLHDPRQLGLWQWHPARRMGRIPVASSPTPQART